MYCVLKDVCKAIPVKLSMPLKYNAQSKPCLPPEHVQFQINAFSKVYSCLGICL